MKISGITSWGEAVPLLHPYEISSMRIDTVDLFFVRISTEDGVEGVGSASPAEDVTGESPEACRTALSVKRLGWLGGRDPRDLDELVRELERSHRATPAARAAVDMALHDLVARSEGVPLVDLLGRCHDALPTSVTIGISSVEETLAEAEDYLGRGFRCLKVKTGGSSTRTWNGFRGCATALAPRLSSGSTPIRATRWKRRVVLEILLVISTSS